MQINPSLVRCSPPGSPERKLARSMIEATQVAPELLDQLESDLTAFGPAWLQRFKQQEVSVAVLKSNQSLADTPLLRSLTAGDIETLVAQGKPLVEAARHEIMDPLSGIADPGERAYMEQGAAFEVADRLHAESNQSELGFTVKVGREPAPLDFLAESHGLDPQRDPEGAARWQSALLQLNGEGLSRQGDTVTPTQGWTVIPYVHHGGRPVRALTLPSLQSMTGQQFVNNLGGNYPENRLVIVHESTLPAVNNMVTGHHRVPLHELGHMMDWICRELPETRDTHEQKVESLFALGQQRAASGQEPFLTERADDSSGEMMAEATEAYLTVAEAPGGSNFYKADNHREALKERFPELHDYIGYLIEGGFEKR